MVHPVSSLYLWMDMVKRTHVVIKLIHQSIHSRTIFIAMKSAAIRTLQTLDDSYGSTWMFASGLAECFPGQSFNTQFSPSMTRWLTQIIISVKCKLKKVFRSQSYNYNAIETEGLVQSILDSKNNLSSHNYHPNKCWPSLTTDALSYYLSGVAGAKWLQGLKTPVSL